MALVLMQLLFYFLYLLIKRLICVIIDKSNLVNYNINKIKEEETSSVKNMGKFYAVKKGLVPGIYDNWPACQANVSNYPGAIFKSFATKEEAEEFLGIREKTIPDNIEPSGSELIAYVDGSYNNDTGMYAYGAIIIMPDKSLIKLSDIGRDKTAASMRNVAGEILGAEQAMLFCLNNGFKSITIYHDYEGISRWCKNEWNANNPFTKAYKARYDKLSENISISFVKVKGHSGDKYNDMVDELAKSMIF